MQSINRNSPVPTYDDRATLGDLATDASELHRQLDRLFDFAIHGRTQVIIDYVLGQNLPRLERDLREIQRRLAPYPTTLPRPRTSRK